MLEREKKFVGGYVDSRLAALLEFEALEMEKHERASSGKKGRKGYKTRVLESALAERYQNRLSELVNKPV